MASDPFHLPPDADEESETRRDGSTLRAELEALASENKELVAELRERKVRRAIAGAGFDPESGEGKAILRTFDGEEATAEAVSEFVAAEFGFEPGPNLDAVAAQRADGEARFAMLTNGALPAPRGAETLQDEIRQAEWRAQETGDWSQFNHLSARRLVQLRQNTPEYGGGR